MESLVPDSTLRLMLTSIYFMTKLNTQAFTEDLVIPLGTLWCAMRNIVVE